MLDRFPVPSLARRCWRPAADVYRTIDGWLVKVELAGVRPEDLRVEFAGRRLVVSGQRRDVVVEVGCSCQSLEISYDSFERWFDFPTDLATQTVDVQFQQGMLLIRLRTA
ncbi:MAG: Hsp20/alpha crystallin family protein [Planctomycetaceae bacterium]|nr:Hsp20/alpha crystallin family protein [Planctomycetaceae bacterium]